VPITNLKDLLLDAEAENKAVGAFSVGNMEMIIGAVKAARELDTPIILQIAEARLRTSPLEYMAPLMLAAAKESPVPIAVHLDHGLSENTVCKALYLGFTSVMLDKSLLPFEENVLATRRVVERASRYGAFVEAELGVVGGSEGGMVSHEISCTDPSLAARFCERTGIDALAVAIGNAHGNYPALPQLRFDILEKIGKSCSVPLVLHGGTGIAPEMFRRAISLGIRKINIATANFDCLARSAKAYAEKADKPDYFELSKAMVDGVYENVKKHITIFNNDWR